MADVLRSIITSIPPPFNMIVMVVLIASTAGVVTSLAKEIRKYTCHREELALKRELLASGYPVEEIERVIRSHRADA